MPEIEIRPAAAEDISALVNIDHTYTSDWVWQMDFQQTDDGQVTVRFREIRLPRSVRVDYPRSPHRLAEDWEMRTGLLVAVLAGEPVGYASLTLNMAPLTAWMTDLVVHRRQRRQGIGSALLLASQEWGAAHGCRHLVVEMQPKNYPGIRAVQKLGFDFCGYNDRYYANHDIGLFFAKSLR
jgi:ribosomal protein S18 acetylase RimI-like enzyme